ncbi:hypothetical protein Tco_0395161, partial [Tanacetum coccineum]
VLNDFLRFFGTLIMKLATSSVVNFALKRVRNIIIENLDLEPKIDAMMRDFLDFAVLPDGKDLARKRVVRSSHVEIDPAGRRSSQLLA